MSATRFCEQCGAPLAADARFCDKCGRAVAVPSVPIAAPARSNQSTWLIAGCLAAIALIACVALIAVGGFFYLQNATPARAPAVGVYTFITPTRAPNPIAPLPTFATPTIAPPSVAPTTAPSRTVTPTLAPTATPTVVPCPPLGARSTSNGAIGPLTFAIGATRDMRPVDPLTRFPEGVTEVVATFPFSGLRNGISVRAEGCLEGNLRYESTYDWTRGVSGSSWTSLYRESGLQAGNYELRIYIASQLAQSGQFTVEKRPEGAPFFGPIRFAEGIQDGKPVNLHTRVQKFKFGIKELYGFYDGGNLTPGMTIRWEWYRDGVIYIEPQSASWSGGATENLWNSLVEDRPLQAGTYTLKLYINNQLVQIGAHVIE